LTLFAVGSERNSVLLQNVALSDLGKPQKKAIAHRSPSVAPEVKNLCFCQNAIGGKVPSASTLLLEAEPAFGHLWLLLLVVDVLSYAGYFAGESSSAHLGVHAFYK
jgi:hypothetical protein